MDQNVEISDPAVERTGWQLRRTAFGLLAASLVCFVGVLAWSGSLPDIPFAILVGFMFAFSILSISVSVRWLRSNGSSESREGKQLPAGLMIVSSLLLIAVPIAYLFWMLVIYEPR